MSDRSPIQIGGVRVGELFASVVDDIVESSHPSQSTATTVDVKLSLKLSASKKKGKLVALFTGGEKETSNLTLELAARIHLPEAKD